MEVDKQLKVAGLKSKAAELQQKINNMMDDIESMTNLYANTVKELYALDDKASSKAHVDMLSRMTGESSINDKYKKCNTSDEMLSTMLKEFAHLNELENPNGKEDKELPDVGDNTEIWDRIADAQRDSDNKDVCKN